MKLNNMKIIIGLSMGLSIAAIAQPTEEQTKFLNEKSIRIISARNTADIYTKKAG